MACVWHRTAHHSIEVHGPHEASADQLDGVNCQKHISFRLWPNILVTNSITNTFSLLDGAIHYEAVDAGLSRLRR